MQPSRDFSAADRQMTRREFARCAAMIPAVTASRLAQEGERGAQATVSLARNGDRRVSLRAAVELLGFPVLKG
ncbi:MAG TPA: hypothetical protein VE398_01825, partial [Acidobacteriota bacterium]|nr:hypothetical protein [Acidobacteriota bacterium]